MGVSKAQLATGEVLIDLTADTVTTSQLGKGITAHDKAGNTLTGTATISDTVSFQNITVPTSAWSQTNTLTDYPYSAGVACSGVTSSLRPFVEFSDTDRDSGILSDDAACYDGGVLIFASEMPTAAITILNIFVSER